MVASEIDRARERFGQLAEELATADSGISSLRKGFGSRSMFVGRKMFAVFDARTGELVVKLPADHAETLISTGVGRGWHPGKGAPLREYVAIPFGKAQKWAALAKEARQFMGEGPAGKSESASNGKRTSS
jgi:hypothetical protein